MNRPAILLAALLASACSGQGGGNGAGGQPAAVESMRAGMWESQMRVLSIEAVGAPAEIQEALRRGVSAAPVFERSCLTPAEAADPVAAFRDRSSRGNAGFTCESGNSVFTGGRIRVTLTCRSSSGQPDLRQAMVGTYGADRFQAAITGETATPAGETMPSYPVRISSTLTGRRIGDCPAGATN